MTEEIATQKIKEITVITPTTGKDSLENCILSLKGQMTNHKINHIILWDNKREDKYLFPPSGNEALNPMDLECEDFNYSCNCIVINDNFINGRAAGSALRAVGLMAVNTEWVTFMDDDVTWNTNHLESILVDHDKEWGFTKRRIWTIKDDDYECLGVDNYESVGEEAKTTYKMVDNNCMFFKAKYGFSAACLYRNTTAYNDDRLMYQFLKKYAQDPYKTGDASINQVCPDRLVKFFEEHCTKDD